MTQGTGGFLRVVVPLALLGPTGALAGPAEDFVAQALHAPAAQSALSAARSRIDAARAKVTEAVNKLASLARNASGTLGAWTTKRTCVSVPNCWTESVCFEVLGKRYCACVTIFGKRYCPKLKPVCGTPKQQCTDVPWFDTSQGTLWGNLKNTAEGLLAEAQRAFDAAKAKLEADARKLYTDVTAKVSEGVNKGMAELVAFGKRAWDAMSAGARAIGEQILDKGAELLQAILSPLLKKASRWAVPRSAVARYLEAIRAIVGRRAPVANCGFDPSTWNLPSKVSAGLRTAFVMGLAAARGLLTRAIRDLKDIATMKRVFADILRDGRGPLTKLKDRIRQLRAGGSGLVKSAIKEGAKKALAGTAVTAGAAGVAMTVIYPWAHLDCLSHFSQKDRERYKKCYRTSFIEFAKPALFDAITTVAMAPLDPTVIIPLSMWAAGLVTAALAPMTAGIGAVAAGAVVGVLAKVGVTLALIVAAEQFYPEYERGLWTQAASFFAARADEAASKWLEGAPGVAEPVPPEGPSLQPVAGPPPDKPPTPPAPGVPATAAWPYAVTVYLVKPDGSLTWNDHRGAAAGKAIWAHGTNQAIGVGWGFQQVFAGPGGVVYAIDGQGRLLWYRHTDLRGQVRWEGPKVVGSGWGQLKQVFAGPGRSVYALNPAGALLWYQHLGQASGTPQWRGGHAVGEGWGGFQRLFAGPAGVIYAVAADGALLWYRHLGQVNGTKQWAGPNKVGAGWGAFSRVFAGPASTVYAVNPQGQILGYRHTGQRGGTAAWQGGGVVGQGWQGLHVFASPDLVRPPPSPGNDRTLRRTRFR
jgi:hypothetical protein